MGKKNERNSSVHQNNLLKSHLKNEELKQRHQQQIEKWEQEKEKLEREYQCQMEDFKNLLKIEQGRKEEVRQRMKSLKPQYLGAKSKTRRGFTEYADNCSFSLQLAEYWEDKIHILREMENYVPDFAYVDKVNCLFIDIEIDEPYTPRKSSNCDSNLKLIHCIGDDNYRDSQFTQADWFVIHFSENQVCQYPDRCCKFIAQLIFDLTGDNSALSKMSHIKNLEREPQWTKSEATQMAKRKSRLSCRCQ